MLIRPNVVYHHLNGGRTIVFRATRAIAAGEEATYSYINDGAIPFKQRARMMYDGFLVQLPPPVSRHRRMVDQGLVAVAKGVDAAQVHIISICCVVMCVVVSFHDARVPMHV